MICSVYQCGRPVLARGLCSACYKYQSRGLNPHDPKRVRLYHAPRTATVRERLEHVGWTETASGCWQWNGCKSSTGYGMFGRHTLAHRAMYEVFKGPIGPGRVVCHTCDNRICVNPDHLWEGTQSENIQDMWDKGRKKRPIKLNPEQRRSIKERRISGAGGFHRAKDLAAEYDVAWQTIYKVWAESN